MLRLLWIALPFALSLLAPAAAEAQCVTPERIRLPGGRAAFAPFTVRWLIGSDSPSTARVQTEGPTPQVVQVLPNNVGGDETITLDARRAQALVDQGVRRLLVVRQYATVTCVVVVEIGALGGPLRIVRLQLRFPDGVPLRVVPLDSELTVWADLSYGGAGELEAVWTVAEAASTRGELIFRPLVRMRRQIEGGGRVSLQSPLLPTDRLGLHQVRLEVLDPPLEFEAPVLRYYVAPEDDPPREPVGIRVYEPRHLAELRQDTRFHWAPVRGAMGYRLEIHSELDVRSKSHLRFDPELPAYTDLRGPGAQPGVYERRGPVGPDPPPLGLPAPDGVADPIAGVLVAGDRTETALTPDALSRLEPGHTYGWTVRALGPAGVPIGMSPVRLLRIPAPEAAP